MVRTDERTSPVELFLRYHTVCVLVSVSLFLVEVEVSRIQSVNSAFGTLSGSMILTVIGEAPLRYLRCLAKYPVEGFSASLILSCESSRLNPPFPTPSSI